MVEHVRQAVRNSGLFARDRSVVAMLSGGRDSTCLLDVAVALLGARSLCALHVNYGLREAAGADERHCALLCQQLGVELQVVRAEPSSVPRAQPLPDTDGGEAAPAVEPTGETRPTGNLQAWARDLRYAAAQRIASERDALIATGHT